MARGLLSRGARLVATRMVLYHRSQERQVGGASRLSLGSPITASVMGQQRIRLGVIQRRALVVGPHQGSLRKRPQPGQGDAGHADSPNTAQQSSLPLSVGV